MMTGSAQMAKGNVKMVDREKVIKGLTVHLSNKVPPCDECPYANFEDTRRYNDPSSCSLSMMADALDLLKEQEPAPPNLMQNANGIWNTCKRCGYILKSAILDIEPEKQKMFFYLPKFCSECGQKVKWE